MGITDSESTATLLGIISGLLFSLLMKLIEYTFPKGHMFKFVKRYAVRVEEEENEIKEGPDADG